MNVFLAVFMTLVVLAAWAIIALAASKRLFDRFASFVISRYEKRQPHKVIGRYIDDAFVPYLVRWKITPWNVVPYKDVPPELRMWWMDLADWIVKRLPKLWLHKFINNDSEAHHDHPWWFGSLVLRGGYFEDALVFDKAGYPAGLWLPNMDGKSLPPLCAHFSEKMVCRNASSLVFHRARHAHKIYLRAQNGEKPPCYTLFLTGGDARPWGFWLHSEHGPVWVPYPTADARRAAGKDMRLWL